MPKPTVKKKPATKPVTATGKPAVTGTANALTRGQKKGITSGKAKAYGLTGTHRTTPKTDAEAGKSKGRFGGPNSGRPSVSEGRPIYPGSKGGGVPTNRGGTQVKKAVGAGASRSAAKKAYKGKNFKAAWKGYKRRVSTRKKPL